MQNLNKFLDFTIFQNRPHDLSDNDEFPLNIDEVYFSLEDEEIKDIDIALLKCVHLITEASNNKKTYIKLKDKYIARYCDGNDIDTSIYYKIDNRYYLFMFRVFYTKTMSIEMVGLVDKQTEQYIFIGSYDNSLFIRCNQFSWVDNCNNGPLMLLSGKLTPNKLLRILSENWQQIYKYEY